MISSKPYKCPCCDTVQNVETNHHGEIYSQCSNWKCKHIGLKCVSAVAKTIDRQRPTLKTKYTYYRYDVSRDDEERLYRDFIRKMITDKGGFGDISMFSESSIEDLFSKHCFNVLSGNTHEAMRVYERMGNCEVTLHSDQPHLAASNQWVHDGGLRLHNWTEWVYQNKNVKEGYYLELTEEMEKIKFDEMKRIDIELHNEQQGEQNV